MFRSSRQSSARQNNGGKQEGSDKLKQKKKLSFRDPEVEKPRPPAAAAADPSAVRAPSLEDLKLEDQALLIARNVGFAFVKPQQEKSAESGRVRANKSFEDCTREDSLLDSARLKPRTEQDTVPNLQAKDQGYLEALAPIKPGPTAMRCPVVEFPPESPLRSPSSVSEQQQPQQQQQQPQQRLPTAAHHQIQLLSYHLEQQRQQTHTAMYQIQLLKDQLEAESAARYKAQVHNHHLMMQNKELLDHIQKLFQQVQDLEKRLEHYERKPVAIHSPGEESQQGFLGPSIGSRRNSSQSLWSSTPSLNPASYSPSRRVSATSLTSPQLDTKPEGARRLSIRDDTSKFNTFDSDWRYRRRGSSGTFASTASLTKTKSNESNSSSTLNVTAADAPRSPTTSLSIPELRLTLDTSNAAGDTPQRRGRLLIGEPSRERTPSPSARRDESPSGRGFKPMQMDTFAPKPRTVDSYESDSEVLIQKKPSRTLGSLKLFNS